MRLAGMPDTKDERRQSSAYRRYITFDKETQSLDKLREGFKGLVIDEPTFKDLEIFDTEGDAKSLFDRCNFTRTEGGSTLLRKRMELPWCEPDRIRYTQESIAFICENREVFKKLPAYIVQSVENYQREVLLGATKENVFEFAIQSFNIYFNHDRHYRSLVRGVQYTCSVVRGLREFIAQEELDSAVGEIVPVLDELREILSQDWVDAVPEQQVAGSWPWELFRLDQVFRLHSREVILRILQLVYELDAVISMADATIDFNFVLPEVLEGEVRVQAEGLTHPFLNHAVANPLHLNQQQRVLFLTGPNMAGKTTYLRALATALYLGHLGMAVPAQSFSFVPVERLFSSISLNDDIHSGISYFRAEALRVRAVAEAISEGRSVVAVMDEPFKGTNVKDAFDASLEILRRFATKEGCLFFFSSHLIELDEQLPGPEHIVRAHFAAQEEQGRLQFDYLLRAGISDQRLGVRVLSEEGVFEFLDK
ncbi:MAG: hypothetical protein MI746_14175 [Pseudomonadales bacterium]|nr:hypothetical protein [Pseudomonadales bacterium]